MKPFQEKQFVIQEVVRIESMFCFSLCGLVGGDVFVYNEIQLIVNFASFWAECKCEKGDF